jgi:hypothetical protein
MTSRWGNAQRRVLHGRFNAKKRQPEIEGDRAFSNQADEVQAGKSCANEYDKLFWRDHEEEELIGRRGVSSGWDNLEVRIENPIELVRVVMGDGAETTRRDGVPG